MLVLRRLMGCVLPYSASALGVGVAAIVTHVVSPLQAEPTLSFTTAVVLTAWLCGRGPAILAIVLSAVAVDYFFLPPIGAVFASMREVVCVVYFALLAGLICYLQENNKRIAADLRVAAGTAMAALKEKEVLLRELQHRVKNNLQIINSLISLHCGKLQDQTTRDLFKECQHRVRAIALVHERLYRAPDLARLDVEAYFRELVQDLIRCYCVNSGSVRPRIVVDEAAVRIDHLIPCALIVNELVCNALKYAFPDSRSGELSVELHKRDGQVTLRVTDDGVGLSPSGVPRVSGVGQQIVNALVDQLAGQLDWANGRGTTATVLFPETK
jgi:two-component sensor histidine kinase